MSPALRPPSLSRPTPPQVRAYYRVTLPPNWRPWMPAEPSPEAASTSVRFTENIPSLGSATINSVSGGFTQISGFELGALSSLPTSSSQNTVGSCTVTTTTFNAAGQVIATGYVTNLDAGAVTLTGPAASSLSSTPLIPIPTALMRFRSAVSAEVFSPGSVNGSIVAGAYSLKGAGGSGVGSFNTSLTLGNPLVINGGLPTSVNRAQGLPLTWTGGNATDIVTSSPRLFRAVPRVAAPTLSITATSFLCTTTAGTGGFTVSSQVLSQLPATASTAAGGVGFLSVTSGPVPAQFTAPLTAGGNVNATFSASAGTAGPVTYN